VLVSNLVISQSQTAARQGNWVASARDARRAETWAPWSSDPMRLLGEAQLGLGERRAAVASFHRAIAKSPQDWNLWFDLARATLGRDQRTALAEAARLNPLSPEVAQLRLELRAEGVIAVAQNGAATGG
jgi:Flp pilus assembly protein TadD